MGLFSSLKKGLGTIASVASPLIAHTGVGAAVGVLGSALASSSSAKSQYDYQSALTDQAYQNNVAFYSQRHQLEVEDLKKAGLNPILSATSGSSMTPATAGTAGMVDSGANSAQAQSNAIQRRLADQQYKIGLINARTELENAVSNRISVQANAQLASSAFDLNYEKVATEQQNRQYQVLNYEMNRQMNNANISKIHQDIINSIALTKAQESHLYSTAQASLIGARASMLGAQASMHGAVVQGLIGIRRNEIEQAGLDNNIRLTDAQISKIQQEAENLGWDLKRSQYVSDYDGSGFGLLGKIGKFGSSVGGTAQAIRDLGIGYDAFRRGNSRGSYGDSRRYSE